MPPNSREIVFSSFSAFEVLTRRSGVTHSERGGMFKWGEFEELLMELIMLNCKWICKRTARNALHKDDFFSVFFSLMSHFVFVFLFIFAFLQ